jgi:hypothetical protein
MGTVELHALRDGKLVEMYANVDVDCSLSDVFEELSILYSPIKSKFANSI